MMLNFPLREELVHKRDYFKKKIIALWGNYDYNKFSYVIPR